MKEKQNLTIPVRVGAEVVYIDNEQEDFSKLLNREVELRKLETKTLEEWKEYAEILEYRDYTKSNRMKQRKPLQLKESDFIADEPDRGFSKVFAYDKGCLSIRITKGKLYGSIYTYGVNLFVNDYNIYINKDQYDKDLTIINHKSFNSVIKQINKKLADIFNAVSEE